jgi:pyroglutamyl-peptidase
VKVLVTGFGPFGEVRDNPSAALARAVEGVRWGDHEILSRVLPVSYDRAPAETIALAREHDVSMVIGFGVAMERSGVCVERTAVHVGRGRPDMDGSERAMTEGPDRVMSSLEPTALAEALGAEVSDDAGRYVCNAWLYKVTEALDCPVGFVHVPADGLPAAALLDALRRLL